MNSGSLLASTWEKSIAAGGEPADQHRDARPALERRQHVVAQPVDEVGGGRRLRGRAGIDLHHGHRARRRDPRRRDGDDVGRRRAPRRASPAAPPSWSPASQLGDEQQRAVEPCPEALGEQVERVPGADVGRIVAGVAGVQAHREHRASAARSSPPARRSPAATAAPARSRSSAATPSRRGAAAGCAQRRWRRPAARRRPSNAPASAARAHEPGAEPRQQRRQQRQRARSASAAPRSPRRSRART